MRSQRKGDIVAGTFIAVLGAVVIVAASQIRGDVEERLPPRTLPYVVGFMTLFAFGLPTGPALAVLLGGLMMYGLQPGPMLFQTNPKFVWAVIASMYILAHLLQPAHRRLLHGPGPRLHREGDLAPGPFPRPRNRDRRRGRVTASRGQAGRRASLPRNVCFLSPRLVAQFPSK